MFICLAFRANFHLPVSSNEHDESMANYNNLTKKLKPFQLLAYPRPQKSCLSIHCNSKREKQKTYLYALFISKKAVCSYNIENWNQNNYPAVRFLPRKVRNDFYT